MCTIMTLSRAFYDLNTAAVVERIKSDGNFNDDGWSIVLLGEKTNQTVTMQSLSLEVILAVIKTDTTWSRFFLHSRAATTSKTGIFGCHNFNSYGNGLKTNSKQGGYLVQHNGILQSVDSKQYLVDSMYIADLISANGVTKTKDYLLAHETYANVFMINPDTGHTVVVRCRTGNLHTDGQNNYSSNAIGTLNTPVPLDTTYEFYHKLVRPTKPFAAQWPLYASGRSYLPTPSRTGKLKHKGKKSKAVVAYAPEDLYDNLDWKEIDHSEYFEDNPYKQKASAHWDDDEFVDEETLESFRHAMDDDEEDGLIPYKTMSQFSETKSINAPDIWDLYGTIHLFAQFDDFLDMVLDYGFDNKNRIPNALYKKFSVDQRAWLRQIRGTDDKEVTPNEIM